MKEFAEEYINAQNLGLEIRSNQSIINLENKHESFGAAFWADCSLLNQILTEG